MISFKSSILGVICSSCKIHSCLPFLCMERFVSTFRGATHRWLPWIVLGPWCWNWRMACLLPHYFFVTMGWIITFSNVLSWTWLRKRWPHLGSTKRPQNPLWHHLPNRHVVSLLGLHRKRHIPRDHVSRVFDDGNPFRVSITTSVTRANACVSKSQGVDERLDL
jgi:hypothetical protein